MRSLRIQTSSLGASSRTGKGKKRGREEKENDREAGNPTPSNTHYSWVRA